MQWYAKLPPARHIAFTGGLLLLGWTTGMGMARLGTPLPYMLGSLVSTALVVALFQRHFPRGYLFPMRFRMVFVGVIGTMIGARLTPAVAALLPDMAISVPAVLVFVLGAHGLNYLIFRRIGRYDPATAYYSGSPGGLIESITFGEEAGADVRILTLQQFLRIIAVVTIVPIGMSIYEGHPVGSAAGMSLSGGAEHLGDILYVFAIAVVGTVIGVRLRIPAGQLLAPLVIAGALSVSGVMTLAPPGWLVAVAQVVLGTGLGIKFTGITRAMMVKGLGLSLLSAGAMLSLGISLAAAVHGVTGLPVDTLVVSFAPGGVVEMALVALSLNANPAIVTLHHLVRILFTVATLTFARRMGWPRRVEP